MLFESAADAYGDRAAGVVLTGANADGAAGLAQIAARGGVTIVQDPETAERREMPDAALCGDARARASWRWRRSARRSSSSPATARTRRGERPSRDTAILLVDDQAENLLALEAVLEPPGCRLVRAALGRRGARRCCATSSR